MRLPRELPHHHIPTWNISLNAQQKKQRWQVATALIESMQSLTQRGEQIVQQMIGSSDFIEWQHYPGNDVRDNARGSQYFYHAHSGLQRPFTEHGHFHLFVHAEELGLRPISTRYSAAPAHVIAVSMDAQGLPSGFFTVNRWVTKGPWLTYAQSEKALQQFQIKGRQGTKEINIFLRALINLYQAHILALIKQRDDIVQKLCVNRDRRSLFADQQIEVLNYHPISLMNDIAEIETLHYKQ